MTPLDILRDLQATLDNLATIQRALTAFPPDLASLEARLKGAERQIADKTKALATARTQIQARERELAAAQVEEERARAAVKATNQKVHYAAAIRELDEKERQKAAILKPLKALTAQAQDLEAALISLEADRAAALSQFDELHAIFLEEHANQVEGRRLLQAKQAELEAQLPTAEVTRFHKLLGARQGKAVAPVENGACSGCRIKLRGPLLFQVKEAKVLTTCESCQRFLYHP